MSETLYATYADPNRARKAAEELLALGVKEAEISLLVKHHEGVKDAREGVDLQDTRPTTPMRGTEFQVTDDPLGNNLRQLSVPNIDRGLDVELNPAQSDYPVGRPGAVEDFSSAPPSARRDFNQGVESDDYNKNYTTNADDEMLDPRQKESIEATPYEDKPGQSLRFSRGYNAISENSPENIKVDPDADAYRDADLQPKSGAHDVGQGVAQGAGIGLGIGAVAALASLLIPGFGLVVGGGALATAAAALVTGTGVGALAGGISGLLQNQGVPEASINRYISTYDSGGAVLAVTVTNSDLSAAIEQTIQANGPIEFERHRAYLA